MDDNDINGFKALFYLSNRIRGLGLKLFINEINDDYDTLIDRKKLIL